MGGSGVGAEASAPLTQVMLFPHPIFTQIPHFAEEQPTPGAAWGLQGDPWWGLGSSTGNPAVKKAPARAHPCPAAAFSGLCFRQR